MGRYSEIREFASIDFVGQKSKKLLIASIESVRTRFK